MNSEEIWQSVKLSEEQEIACNFIYDGLRNLHDMETLGFETEIFPVLYNLSIGIERLLKIAIILLEFNDKTDIDVFTESLKSHKHIILLNRINKITPMSLENQHIDLLNLLSDFYTANRYRGFSLWSVKDFSKDKDSLHKYIYKYLNINLAGDFAHIHSPNSSKIKSFIGKTVKEITKKIYSIIEKTANEKNIYTYEISSAYSKASKIVFGEEEITFEKEDIALMEILIFIMHTKKAGLIKSIKKIKPLPLDSALEEEYLRCLIHKDARILSSVIDEVESYHEDIENLNYRLELIKAYMNHPDYF